VALSTAHDRVAAQSGVAASPRDDRRHGQSQEHKADELHGFLGVTVSHGFLSVAFAMGVATHYDPSSVDAEVVLANEDR
jgi:hypothetical protein